MSDFKVVPVQNHYEMQFVKNDNILTEIVLTFLSAQGRWFFNPNWGHNLASIKKVTTKNVNLAQQYLSEAMQWIVDVGHAKSITVLAEADSQDTNRINYKITAVQANGFVLVYTVYKRVI